jgi:hypothetical protein
MPGIISADRAEKNLVCGRYPPRHHIIFQSTRYDMPRYAITERAGPFVAAHRNTGVGTVLELTERQAEHELRLGTLVRLPEPHENAAAEPQIESSAVDVAMNELSTTPLGDQEAGAPMPTRKSKRSAT